MIKIFEPAVIIVIVTVLSIFLPKAFSCTQFTCIEGKTGQTSIGCYNDTRNPLHIEPSVKHYTCTRGSVWKLNNTTMYTNSTYNEMATLMFGTLENAVKHLFSRDTHYQFGFSSLFAMLAINFFFICWSTGTAVASGALVPMLLVGGLYGRIVGLLMTHMFGPHSEDYGYWAWMDPGAFALIGAASFFGGVTRLALAVTVIMMELTNDVQALLPVMVSVMIAKWVGDFFTHPIYHALLELKCIPILDPEPRVRIDKTQLNLELYCAKDVMSSPVITIHTKESVAVLAQLLADTTYGGFPVIKKNKSGEECFFGLITRMELLILLNTEVMFDDSQSQDDSADDTPSGPSWIEYEQLNVSRIKNPHQVTETLHRLVTETKYKSLYLDLSRYINQSAMSIPKKFSLQRTYIIFRTLGLRHLTVVDRENIVRGIITRKDLMGFSMQERLQEKISSEMTEMSAGRSTVTSQNEPI